MVGLAVLVLCFSAQADFAGYGFFGVNGAQVPDPNVSVLKLPEGLTLQAPVVFEDFEGGTEFQLASVGWSGRNFTDPISGHDGTIPNDPQSDSYLGWVLLSRPRLESVFDARRLEVAPGQQFNGNPVTQLLFGNLLYAESDNRGGDQVQILLSPVYDFTGQRNLVLAFNSAYEQNQDSFGGLEFTTDRGTTWQPVIYMIDRDDIVLLGDGIIDAVATLTAPHSDVASYTDPINGGQVGGSYGAFVAASLSQELAPFISGRVNDDPGESKRVEVFRIPGADDNSSVQFRLVQAGTASWYWGIDNWGIYKAPPAETVSINLKNQATGTPTAINVALTVSGRKLSARIDSATTGLPAPESGSDADRAFGVDLTAAASTVLPGGQLHQLAIGGLDPTKAYELTLYSDLARGGGATGAQLSYTLVGATSFRNDSSRHPPLATVAGDLDQTATIDITDNSGAGRGFVCRFSRVHAGTDGIVRVQMESADTACLTSLKLVETTPETVAISAPAEVTGTGATLHGEVATEGTQHIHVYWGRSNGGVSPELWDQVIDLGELGSGEFSYVLEGLETFRDYFYVLHSMGDAGEFWSPVATFRPQTLGLLYATSFEPGESEPFVPGSLHGQGPSGMWRVNQGEAVVQAGTASTGIQSVQAGECMIDVAFASPANVLWVDAFFMESGTTNQPIVPTNIVSSVVFFSATDGILALDGNGGGGGSFVNVVPDFPKDRFVRLTIRNDYVNKRYDVWVDGVLNRAGLGFKDNSVQTLSGARRRSIQSNYMDDFSVSIWGLDADSDGDGLGDLDEAKFYGSYPLLADSDGDGANDGQEVLARTDPADPGSLFAVKIDVNGAGDKVIRIPTMTGLQYTLQRRGALDGEKWQDVPEAAGVAGDGREKVFLETPDGDNYFYRGVIINR